MDFKSNLDQFRRSPLLMFMDYFKHFGFIL